jgi:hypothetical protein
MSEHEWAEQYEIAIKRFYDHLSRAEDGTFRLSIEDGASAGIDPATFADLKRSLEQTNKMIRLGKLDPKEVESMLLP